MEFFRERTAHQLKEDEITDDRPASGNQAGKQNILLWSQKQKKCRCWDGRETVGVEKSGKEYAKETEGRNKPLQGGNIPFDNQEGSKDDRKKQEKQLGIFLSRRECTPLF